MVITAEGCVHGYQDFRQKTLNGLSEIWRLRGRYSCHNHALHKFRQTSPGDFVRNGTDTVAFPQLCSVEIESQETPAWSCRAIPLLPLRLIPALFLKELKGPRTALRQHPGTLSPYQDCTTKPGNSCERENPATPMWSRLQVAT